MALDQNWNLFRAGNKDAFEHIYRMHINSLYGYGRHFSKEINVVEDCVQDMFIELWSRRSNLGDTDNVKGYLFLSLRRRIIKQVKVSKNISLEEDMSKLNFDAELSIDHIMINEELTNEQSTLLKNAFETLSPNQREILYLKFHQDIDSKDIAVMLDINYQSVRNAISRALIKMRKQMSLLLLLLFLIILKITEF